MTGRFPRRSLTQMTGHNSVCVHVRACTCKEEVCSDASAASERRDVPGEVNKKWRNSGRLRGLQGIGLKVDVEPRNYPCPDNN